MKTLRILNVVALLVIFTPFFQMCSNEKSESPAPVASSTHSDDSVLAQTDSTDESPGDTTTAVLQPMEVSTANVLDQFWEQITFPGENFTATGLGLLLIAILEVVDGHPENIWIGTVFLILSLILLTTTLVKTIRSRTNRLRLLLLLNVLAVAAMFAAAFITLEELSQVKWGYYLYLAISGFLYLQSRRVTVVGTPHALTSPQPS
jgi:hypothetical protein